MDISHGAQCHLWIVLGSLLVCHLQDLLDDVLRLHVRGDHQCQSVCFILLCSVTYFIDCLAPVLLLDIMTDANLAYFHSRLLPFVPLPYPLHLVLQGHVQHHYLQLWAQLGPVRQG